MSGRITRGDGSYELAMSFSITVNEFNNFRKKLHLMNDPLFIKNINWSLIGDFEFWCKDDGDTIAQKIYRLSRIQNTAVQFLRYVSRKQPELIMLIDPVVARKWYLSTLLTAEGKNS